MWRTWRSFSISPFSSSSRSSSYERSKWSSIARFWLDVTMITCSIPAATASSTAYWITGLSTSGSISLGCAFVAGRNLVPQPAAGKTAFRTRMEPRVRTVWVGPARIPSALRRTLRARSSERKRRVREPADRGRERVRLIEVRQVGRPADQDTTRIRRDPREGSLGRPEEEVELAVDQEARPGIGGEPRPEPLADERPDRDRATGEREAVAEDRLGDPRRIAP